jgi:signal transduction histidine kinase
MLTTILIVQLLNFAVVLLVPPPAADIYSVSQIATALRRADGQRQFRLGQAKSVPPQSEDWRALSVRDQLAARLSFPLDRVRVELTDPKSKGLRAFGLIIRPPFGRPSPGHSLEERGLVFGAFDAAVRPTNGAWRTLQPIGGAIGPWRNRALLWLLVAIAVIAPVAWVLARRVANPIGLFAAAADRLGRNPGADPLPLTGPPEIIHAAAAFNNMQARLHSYVEDRTTLVAAIAHDLRTPLMKLSLRLEKAPEQLREAAEGDIREMEDRIAAAMSFVRDMTRATRRDRLDLRSLAESVSDDFADRGADVVLADGGPAVVHGDPAALKAVLTNMIGNAVKYAGRTDVSLDVTADSVRVMVCDRGPGMLPQDLARAFEPFFRGERSRNRDTGGVGLGLASVRAVMTAHGGDVQLLARRGGGLRAIITLPL